MIIPVGELTPRIDSGAWIASTASVIGDVFLAEDVSIWYNAVLRADGAEISVGVGTNVQDGCVIHTDPGYPVALGSMISVGHNATLHGCIVDDDALIGMGATVLNRAHIGAGSLVAAGALVPEHMVVPPHSLVAGVPAKVRRPLSAEEIDNLRINAQNYLKLRDRYRAAESAQEVPDDQAS